MTMSIARSDIRNCFKVLAAVALFVTQCITITPEIKGQTQSQPAVDLPSLAGKSMGDIIQEIKKPKKCREVDKEFLARVTPNAPTFDDICYFKIESGRLGVVTYRGRTVAFVYFFGQKAPTEPEEALRRVGINVNGAKPQIQENPLRFYVWSGTFNEKRWKEVKVHQVNPKNRRCPMVIA